MYQQIEPLLERYGYRRISLNIAGVYLSLLQQGNEGYVVVTLDETTGIVLEREQFLHISEQIRDFLRKRNCYQTHFLYLLLTDREDSARRLFANYECFFRVAVSQNRLMVYELVDPAYVPLQRELERMFPGREQYQGNSYQSAGYQENDMAYDSRQGNGWRYDRRGRWLPYCNIAIIVINVLVFLFTDFFALTASSYWTDAGAVGWQEVFVNGEWYRVLTSLFLHGGIQHIFNNMLILGYVGSYLEQKTGSIRYGIIYLGSGILAAFTSMVYNMWRGAYIVSIGASGAVFGAIGGLVFMVLFGSGSRDRYSVRQMVVLSVLSLYGGFANPGVDNAAHIGGFIAGFLLTGLLWMLRKREKNA